MESCRSAMPAGLLLLLLLLGAGAGAAAQAPEAPAEEALPAACAAAVDDPGRFGDGDNCTALAGAGGPATALTLCWQAPAGAGCVAWRLASAGPPAGWLSVAFVAAEDAGKMGPGWGVVASDSGGTWAVQEMEVSGDFDEGAPAPSAGERGSD